MQAQGVRIAWGEVPSHVRAAVEDVLGDRVVRAVSQPGGFSPGTADRVVTAGGRRAFVKAVSPAQNPVTPGMHRREIVVTAALPASAPVPRLLGSFDDGNWVALVLADVDGHHPVTPWRDDHLAAVLDACADLAASCTPAPALPRSDGVDDLAEELRSWELLRQTPHDGLEPWATAHLTALCDLGREAVGELDGDTLVHGDLRADNILLGADGTVTMVDWPAAFVGPDWMDTLSVIMNAVVNGHTAGDALVDQYLPHVAPRTITACLAGLAGYFLEHARRPPPPGLPTVRAFQLLQGRAVLRWVRSQLDSKLSQ